MFYKCDKEHSCNYDYVKRRKKYMKLHIPACVTTDVWINIVLANWCIRKYTLEFPERCDTSLYQKKAQNISPLTADVFGLEKNIVSCRRVALSGSFPKGRILFFSCCTSIKGNERRRTSFRNGIRASSSSPYGLKSNARNSEIDEANYSR